MTRRFLHYAILPHPSERCILLLQGPAGWALPQFASNEHYLGEVEHINQTMRGQLRVNVTVLRCMRNALDPQTNTVRRVYELENHSPDWIPPAHGRWFRQEELKEITLAQLDQRAVLESWFREEKEGRTLRDGQEWTQPGWWDQAIAWIEQQLRQRGFGEIQVIAQRKAWEVSCVLRLSTNEGAFYFKAVPASLAREPVVTQRLAELYPHSIPPVVAVEPERRWFLMQAVHGPMLIEVSDLSSWEHAVHIYAHMQIDWVGRAEELLALGCPDRTLARLEEEIDPLLADTSAMLPCQPEGLSMAEIERLQNRAPEFRAMCHELQSYAIPPSLEHGDLWAINVIMNNDTPAFIDWDDACLSHPFFSLLELMHSTSLSESPDTRARIRDAYLTPWTRYEPMDRLVQAFDLSQQLAALHYAASYRRILPMIEIEWELRGLVPFFLKLLVTEG